MRSQLPPADLTHLQTDILSTVIERRAKHWRHLVPCSKEHLSLMMLNDVRVESCTLLQLYPLLLRLKKRHETLTQIVHDMSSYNQVIGIHLPFLRPSDCIAVLCPQLSELFLESLVLDRLEFHRINALENYLKSERMSETIGDFCETRWTCLLDDGQRFRFIRADAAMSKTATTEHIRKFFRRTIDEGRKDVRPLGYQSVSESGEFHAYFACEWQYLLNTLYEEMRDNLLGLAQKFNQSVKTKAAESLRFSQNVLNETGVELRSQQTRMCSIDKQLSDTDLSDADRSGMQQTKDELTSEIISKRIEYDRALNQKAVVGIRQLISVHDELKRFSEAIPALVFHGQDNRSVTSIDFHVALFQRRSDYLQSNAEQFDASQRRLNSFIGEKSEQLTKIYDEYMNKLAWLDDNDGLRQVFERFLVAYRLSHQQFFHALRNWMHDLSKQRTTYVKEIRTIVDKAHESVRSVTELLRPIIKVREISSIPVNVPSVHRSVAELSRVTLDVEKFASEYAALFPSRNLSILLQHCASIHARIAMFVVQLFHNQHANSSEVAQLKALPIKVGSQTFKWDEQIQTLLRLSHFQSHADVPGTSLPNDEYTLKEFHQQLCHDYSLLEHSFGYLHTHAFTDLSCSIAALIDEIERKVDLTFQLTHDSLKNEQSTSLIQVSYLLSLLVHNCQTISRRVLNEDRDQFEEKTQLHLSQFCTELSSISQLTCSSPSQLLTTFLEFVLNHRLDNLLEEGLLFLDHFYLERAGLEEALGHIRSLLEHFVEQCFQLLIGLFQHEKEDELSKFRASRLPLLAEPRPHRQLTLIESYLRAQMSDEQDSLRVSDLEQIDWYRQLVTFLSQAWLQASRLIATFAGPVHKDQE